jgi:hypothetical protein
MDLTFVLTGTRPLIMHNARLSNPLDPHTQRLAKITKKRGKTIEDHREVARLEWEGSLYHDAESGIHVPAANVERSLLDAARMFKLGTKVQRGLFVTSDAMPLDIGDQRSAGQIIDDENFRLVASVKVGQQRVMRCRPCFRSWSITGTVYLDESQIEPDQLRQIMDTAGRLVGLGDWRPRYGRFSAEVSA